MHSVIQICKWRRERPQHMLGDPNIQRICNFDQPVRPMHTGFIEAGHRIRKKRVLIWTSPVRPLSLTLILTQDCAQNDRFAFSDPNCALLRRENIFLANAITALALSPTPRQANDRFALSNLEFLLFLWLVSEISFTCSWFYCDMVLIPFWRMHDVIVTWFWFLFDATWCHCGESLTRFGEMCADNGFALQNFMVNCEQFLLVCVSSNFVCWLWLHALWSFSEIWCFLSFVDALQNCSKCPNPPKNSSRRKVKSWSTFDGRS
jgi:hypothetical protein